MDFQWKLGITSFLRLPFLSWCKFSVKQYIISYFYNVLKPTLQADSQNSSVFADTSNTHVFAMLIMMPKTILQWWHQQFQRTYSAFCYKQTGKKHNNNKKPGKTCLVLKWNRHCKLQGTRHQKHPGTLT